MERCFSHREDGAIVCENVSKEVVLVEDDVHMMLWHGPVRCGKSSLVFQYAFDLIRAATQDGGEALPYVILVCHESMKNIPERFVPIEPCDACHTPLKSGRDVVYWERIRIKYLQNAAQLCHFACSLHTLGGGKCLALIVDDFDLFMQDSVESELYRCLALLTDTLDYLRRTHGTGQIVVVSSTQMYSKEERHRLRRWFQLLVEILPQTHPQIYAMQEELPPPSTQPMRDWAAYFPHFPVPYRVLYHFEPNESDHDGLFRFLHAG